MQINIDALKGVTPVITSAKNRLNSCKGIIASINIPGDFPEGGKIRGTIGKIGNIESMLNSSLQSVNSSISKYQATTQKNNQIIDKLFGGMMNFDIITKKNSSKKSSSETTNIFGIKVYQPGEKSINRNLVRKPKRDRKPNGQYRRIYKNSTEKNRTIKRIINKTCYY